jgi:hypothetical protein
MSCRLVVKALWDDGKEQELVHSKDNNRTLQ